jgi:hypothetical protein
VLEPLARLAPDRADVQNMFAMALWHSGRRDEAWSRMKGLSSRYPEDQSIRGNFLQMKARRSP